MNRLEGEPLPFAPREPDDLIGLMVPASPRPVRFRKTLENLQRQNATAPSEVAVADSDGKRGGGEEVPRARGVRSGSTCERVAARGLGSKRTAGPDLAVSDPDASAVAVIDDDAEANSGSVEAIVPALRCIRECVPHAVAVISDPSSLGRSV